MRHKKQVPESIARSGRTAIQATPAFLITQLIDSIHDLSDYQFGIVVLLLTAAISYAQTEIENHTGVAVLRSVPPTKSPVVDEEG